MIFIVAKEATALWSSSKVPLTLHDENVEADVFSSTSELSNSVVSSSKEPDEIVYHEYFIFWFACICMSSVLACSFKDASVKASILYLVNKQTSLCSFSLICLRHFIR